MKKLKLLFLNKTLFWAVLGGVLVARNVRGVSSAGDLVLSKDLVGVPGSTDLQGGPYSLSFAWGQTLSGHRLANSSHVIESGYYGGRFGAGQNFHVVRIQVGEGPAYSQNGLRVGVILQAPLQITFSDQLDSSTIDSGITILMRRDHMTQPTNSSASWRWSYDPARRTLEVLPQDVWQGNSLYVVVLTSGLASINSYALEQDTHIPFLTMANPHEHNVIQDPVVFEDSAFASSHQTVPSLRVEVPPEALSDYSVLLFNSSPLESPWRVDPEIIQEATRKAQASEGSYQAPIALLEVASYNPHGEALSSLLRTAQMSIAYDSVREWLGGTPAPVHASTLSLWVLDEKHRLWVKIPASHTAGSWVNAPITRFSVFALMGGPLGTASDVFVFPNPWRPHGPNAGDGSGQTGTDLSGLTFSNLPSECTLKIYTLNGQLVRELHHSDIVGPIAQEKWDGTTTGGSHVASGVYLWRVESSQDGKNGKLIIIR